MKIYVLAVTTEDFEYDQISDAVVLAESPEQALAYAKEIHDVKWKIDKTVEIDTPGIVELYHHPG